MDTMLLFGQIICVLSVSAVLLWIVSRLLSKRHGSVTGVQDGYRSAVLITGCDSGFGHCLAQRLDGAGLVVFAGCLFPSGPGAQSLARSCSSHLKVLPLDVTSDEQVQRAKEAVGANLPENGLWAVVNNAGISDWGETEWNSIKDYSQMVDVNLLGSIRTSIAFLPMVRHTKGRMVFVSSMMAVYTCPYMGAYSLSKRGLEAFADCLRVEMDTFGVKVCIVQPGNFGSATNIVRVKTGQDIWERLDEERRRAFSRRYVDGVAERAAGAVKRGSNDAGVVVDAMLDAILSRRPRSRYLVASSVSEAIFLHLCPYLPTRLADAMLSHSPMMAMRKEMLCSK